MQGCGTIVVVAGPDIRKVHGSGSGLITSCCTEASGSRGAMGKIVCRHATTGSSGGLDNKDDDELMALNNLEKSSSDSD